MYKTAVNTLVNVVITRQKQQISKSWYCSAVNWHLGNVMLRNITCFLILLFLMCNAAVNYRLNCWWYVCDQREQLQLVIWLETAVPYVGRAFSCSAWDVHILWMNCVFQINATWTAASIIVGGLVCMCIVESLCDPNPCRHSGTCLEIGNSNLFRCLCDSDFRNKFCDDGLLHIQRTSDVFYSGNVSSKQC